VTGEDGLWQKERLLNLALRALPAGCDRVAWLDCDVVIASSDWAPRVHAALDRFPLVQAFRRFHELDAAAPTDDLSPAIAIGGGESFAHRPACGETVEQLFSPGRGNRIQREMTVGLAWAAHRALLDRHGFYDACVVGGGDKAIISAALGRYESMSSLDANERQMGHDLRWARPFFSDVRGRIGSVDAEVYHLWHGDLSFRKHRARHRQFARFSFDPFVDIALDARGGWRWNSDKPEMHTYVSEYLASRREDG
jgi:hypothetical protein